ncbi:hypothetical protein CH333_01130 [candidate division WOR-3 bacterium JGI_Cruoil_03_44_89]|uniref:UPF0235 protein CH333_01130 n=1 Tax=candidate division WOR-3 bacterium JGI_Cruoil_03_44_89 TaxID=1973748 RepID=A0A235BYV3_UNCW3|nr:MAG: hypothetical protein CH333_01130 [candidate division WOR-3 bacterium JGI_Cruoil_03_44_89]
MRITVRVIPRARKRDIKKQPDGSYKIKVLSPPIDGRANSEVIDVIAKEYGVKRSKVKIISGEKRREKVVEIQVR